MEKSIAKGEPIMEEYFKKIEFNSIKNRSMNKRSFTLLALVLLLMVNIKSATAQEMKKFSLQEAISYALENSFTIKNAKLDEMISLKRSKEYLAIGMPQIQSNLKYNDFIDIPTSMIPGEFFGQPAGTFTPVKFGIKYNTTFDISVSQLIFNGSYLAGLEASKKLEVLAFQTVRKTESEIRESVAKAYYLVLVAEENKRIVDSTVVTLAKMLFETREFFKNGFVENTDVDQVELLLSNLESTQKTLEKRVILAYKLLKLQIGYPLEWPVTLTDNLENLLPAGIGVPLFDFSSNIDFRLMETQRDLAKINLKNEKAAYYPTIGAFYSYQKSAQRNEFDFFDFSQDWFPTNVWGIQLSIPIFSSGSRKYRVDQAKYSLEKSNMAIEQVKKALIIQAESAQTDFEIAYLTWENKKKNMNLAKAIYNKTTIKYKEGVAGSFEYSQSYNQYLTAQTEYFNSLMMLLNAKEALDKLNRKSN